MAGRRLSTRAQDRLFNTHVVGSLHKWCHIWRLQSLSDSVVFTINLIILYLRHNLKMCTFGYYPTLMNCCTKPHTIVLALLTRRRIFGGPLRNSTLALQHVRRRSLLVTSSLATNSAQCNPRGVLREWCQRDTRRWLTAMVQWRTPYSNGTKRLAARNQYQV